MIITRFELITQEELLSNIRSTKLKGYNQFPIYAESRITLETVNADSLIPAQRYVLDENIRRIHSLREYFCARGIDIFKLGGGIRFWYRDDEEQLERGPVPLIPPVIEESEEDRGNTVLLINDGMHRIYAAREVGEDIAVIVVRNVSRDYPYYAYPLSEGWQEVQRIPEIPDGFVKKTYRDPANYKSLFRNFNEILPGVQEERKQGVVQVR